MANKRRHPDRPIALHGRVVFEFYNNDDEEFKVRALKSLAKEARKEFNVSCVPIEEHMVENPELGTLILSLSATSEEKGKAELDRVLKFFDGKAPARILSEEFEQAEIE